MTKRHAPQQATAATGRTAEFTTELPKLVGNPPRGLEHAFQSVPAPAVPELATLPAPRARCPFTQRSRTWLIESAEEAKRDGMPFLFRIRQRGKTRGAVFLRIPVLMQWLAMREAEENQGANGKEGASHE